MGPGSVRVRVLSFGPWRTLLAEGGELWNLSAGATVADLLDQLQGQRGFQQKLLCSAAVSVNREYAMRTQPLNEGDEVAVLPPVSGGTVVEHTPATQVTLGTVPIDSNAVLAGVKSGGDGAVCIFDGIVRNNTRGRETLHLDYEAYEAMALKELRALRMEALARFPVREVAIAHRLGRLVVGDTSVLIAVASAHRAAAFEACRWIIDSLKQRVPIWKREQFVDGAVWADGEPFPEDLVEARP